MWIEASCELEARIELLATEGGESLFAELEASFDELDMRPLP